MWLVRLGFLAVVDYAKRPGASVKSNSNYVVLLKKETERDCGLHVAFRQRISFVCPLANGSVAFCSFKLVETRVFGD